MEGEYDPRLQALQYKVRASSRESPSQKAAYVLDSDLRTHWSTGTNAKEWIVLELEESCLLSHIRIHNKSVLEWEIAAGLKFKPETFVKVKPRCEAPRREMTYYTGYLPCRFIRISCLRGNPIAIFYIQLMGIPVPGLEPELQPVVDFVLPHIISQRNDSHGRYLKFLQDITNRLTPFLPQLESELVGGNETIDSSVKLLAMFIGPFYPILATCAVRNAEKNLSSAESTRSQGSVLSVSSNFQAPPKRGKSPGLSQKPVGYSLAYRYDAVLLLLKVASKNSALSSVCKKVAVIYNNLGVTTEDSDGNLVSANGADYSDLFGEEYRIPDDVNLDYSTALEASLVEEGLLHVLYGLASQPALCRRLTEAKSDLIPVLPFVQAIVPALRPASSTLTEGEVVDETFGPWQASEVQRAVTHVVALSTSPLYRPLLDSCSEYLASFFPAHEKAACILIDLCTGPLSPWLPLVISKVDLAIELLEDLIGVIQAGQKLVLKARAALIYLILGLSGYVDDVMTQYKDVKHNLLFLIEILEPYLFPAISSTETIAFGDVPTEKSSSDLALDIICTAVKKPAVLPALEAEWRHGRISPSVLLSILAPHLPVPSGVDTCRCTEENSELREIKFGEVNETENKDAERIEESISYFAPPELKVGEQRHSPVQATELAQGLMPKSVDDLQADYLQLINSAERELRASEFIRFAVELHSQAEANPDSKQAAIDALLLAAECHLNPWMEFQGEYQRLHTKLADEKVTQDSKDDNSLEVVSQLEEDRDKSVLRILLQASGWDLEGDLTSQELEGLSIQSEDETLEDAATIVRQHQIQLCTFFVNQLQRGIHSMHDVLLHGLLFVLEASTGSITTPEEIVNVIIMSAERFNKAVLSHSSAGFRRKWSLLNRLVHVTAGVHSQSSNMELRRELIPISTWVDSIEKFAYSSFPLVRYIGWMSLSIYSQTIREGGLLFVSNMEELTNILLIFSDELTTLTTGNINNTEQELHPELHELVPNLRPEFEGFAKNLLDTVCEQMKNVSPPSIPDLLSWFTELCTDNKVTVKASNMRRVILRLLEVIVTEHMELLVPEMPRIIRMLIKLCSTSFCDVSMLDTVLSSLKPLVTYYTTNNAANEDFHIICFGALLERLKEGGDVSLVLYLCGFLLEDISSSLRVQLYASLVECTEFTRSSATGSYGNYLQALAKILESISLILSMNNESQLPVHQGKPQVQGETGVEAITDATEQAEGSLETDIDEDSTQEHGQQNTSSSSEFLDDNLEIFLEKLGTQLEVAWKLHPKLVQNVGRLRAHCFMYREYMKRRHEGRENEEASEYAVLYLTKSVTASQNLHCWQLAALTMDFILNLSSGFQREIRKALPEICSVLQYQSSHAPRLSWRLKTGRWLSRTLQHIGLELATPEATGYLVPLLRALLEHPEPEIRFTVNTELDRLLELNGEFETAGSRYLYDKFKRQVVDVTWERIFSLAVSDFLASLRQQALELLLKYIPLASPDRIRSLLRSFDAILRESVMKSSKFSWLVLALLARSCIYASPEDISSIPAKVWNTVERHANTKPGAIFREVEAGIALCKSLLQLRQQGETAKQDVEKALDWDGNIKRPYDPEFLTVRASVLDVFARLSVLREQADTTKEAGKEIERSKAELETPGEEAQRRAITKMTESDSLQPAILAEASEVTRAKRELQRLAQRDRHLVLEEAAHRELMILQELDRERAAEAEREIERQKILERERVKTREMRHALDMEMERRAQRDYQRELEQQRDGRGSRREYTSSSSSRPRERDRYRERENAITPPPTPPPSNATGSPGNNLQSPLIMTNTNRQQGLNLPYEDLLGNNGSGFSEYGDYDDNRQGRSGRQRMLISRDNKDGGRGKWEKKQAT